MFNLGLTKTKPVSKNFIGAIVDSFFQKWMEQKGITFDHNFYVVVGKKCRTLNDRLLLICFKLVMISRKLC